MKFRERTVRSRSTVSSSTSELTIPRNLRGRFRGSGEVGDVRDRVFQHLKIDFSTLNLGVPILVRFVPILVRQLVNIGPGQYRYGRIDWLSRSGAEPGCLGGLVRRRSFALLGTRVRAPALSSSKILQKSSKSEKILDRHPLCTNFGTIRTNFGTPVPILVRSVPILVRSASGSVLSFPCKHSEVLSGTFAVSLWASLGTRTKDLDVASPAS